MISKTDTNRTAVVCLFVMAVSAHGCATAPVGVPQLDTSELTDDGLARVTDARVDAAYMKPDADLARYTAVIVDPVSVAYKRPPKPNASRLESLRGRESNFPLTPEQMQNFQNMFQWAVTEALTENNGFRLTSVAGPDVLRVHAELIDLIVKVPTEQGVGREYVFVDSLGEVTLIGELRDSESGEILARAVDRQVHRSAPGRLEYSNPVSNAADARRLFRRWADLLRARLDALKSMPVQKPTP